MSTCESTAWFDENQKCNGSAVSMATDGRALCLRHAEQADRDGMMPERWQYDCIHRFRTMADDAREEAGILRLKYDGTQLLLQTATQKIIELEKQIEELRPIPCPETTNQSVVAVQQIRMEEQPGTSHRKLIVRIDPLALEILETLRSQSGAQTIGLVVRDAIAFYEWARAAIVERGLMLALVNRKEGRVREYWLPFSRPEKKS